MRLFLAAKLPDYIHEALDGLREELPGVRWVEREQLHLTLKFLGEVEEARLGTIEDALAGLDVERFFLPLEGVGKFPKRGATRVLWAGLGRGHPRLFQLHKLVNDQLFQHGFEPDKRIFHPHLTLARCGDVPANQLKAWLRRYAGFEAAPFTVSQFHLYSSKLLPGGPLYRIESSWSLR